MARVITVGITWLSFPLVGLIVVKPTEVESNFGGLPDVFLSLGRDRHGGAGLFLSCLERLSGCGFRSVSKRHLERSFGCSLTHISSRGIVNDNSGALGLINLLTIAILHLNESRLLRLIISLILIALHSELALLTYMAVDLDLATGSAIRRNLLRTWRDSDCCWTEALNLDASRLGLG